VRHVQASVLFNVIEVRALHALARLARRTGDEQLAAWARRRADTVAAALLERCWDERAGLFFALAGRPGRQNRTPTVASLAPLALPGLPARMAARLAERLEDPRTFQAPFGVPSVAIAHPSFQPRNRVWGVRFIWRGAASMNTNWLLVHGLREQGLDEAADALAARSRAAVERSGFNEFYDPLDGSAVGAENFGWATLACLM
jgi:hypothetical protein